MEPLTAVALRPQRERRLQLPWCMSRIPLAARIDRLLRFRALLTDPQTIAETHAVLEDLKAQLIKKEHGERETEDAGGRAV